MGSLRVRLAITMAALALIVLSLLDVAFLLWAQGSISRERALAVRGAAAAAAVALAGAGDDPTDALETAAAPYLEYGVALTVEGNDGRQWRSITSDAAAPLPPAPPAPGAQELVASEGAWTRQVSAGYEHIRIAVPGDPRWRAVVASRSLSDAFDAALRLQRRALPVLVTAALLVVGLGLWFLGRTVLRPMHRMTELVGSRDYDGLRALAGPSRESFASLSHAILGMTQRIESDREAIAAQLRELTAAHAELEATQDRLVRADRLAVVGQLSAGLAHEIGNPLAVVRGFVDVLRAEAGPEGPAGDAGQALGRMSVELDRISGTVRNLLDFSRASNGSRGAGDAAAAIAHVEALLRPQERMRKVTLEVSAPPGPCPVGVTTDALTQVLLNLLLNAADAAGAAGGGGTIRVTLEAGERNCTLTVEDSGPGIPPGHERRIFEPFFTTKAAGAGTGLGLSVCERIVTAAGGEIHAGRGDLGGARFTVAVPRGQVGNAG